MTTLTITFESQKDKAEFLFRLAKSNDMDLTLYGYGDDLLNTETMEVIVHEQKETGA